MKTRSRRDVEWSESSSDDYDDAEVIRWDSAREHFSQNDRRHETKVMHRGGTKHNTYVGSMSASQEMVNNSLNHTGASVPAVVMMLTLATKMILRVPSQILNIPSCHSKVFLGT